MYRNFVIMLLRNLKYRIRRLTFKRERRKGKGRVIMLLVLKLVKPMVQYIRLTMIVPV